MLGPFTNRRFLWPSGYMLAFCQACCPRLEILIPLDDRQYQNYWMGRGFVPDSLTEEGKAIRLVLRG